MSSLAEQQAKAKEHLASQNPTAAPGKSDAERQRIPMSVPERKLEVPPIPGYYVKWFRGTPQRIAQAQRAGFSFVTPEDVKLNNVSLGGDATKAGNAGMGSLLEVLEGGLGEDGQPLRLVCMKQKMEHYLEDRAISDARNDSVAQALTAAFQDGTAATGAGQQGERTADVQNRYVDKARTKIPEFFRKKALRLKPT